MALDEPAVDERVNAVIGWALAVVVTAGAAESFLSEAYLWGGFALFVVAVVSLPTLVTRDWTAIVPWPIVAVGAVAVAGRAAGLYPEVAAHFAVASLALVVVVELDLYTSVEFSSRFAVVFGVLTTLAIEALWVVAQFYSDVWLGTEFLRSQTELQQDIVAVAGVAFAAGGFFYWYLVRFGPASASERASNRGETS